MARLKWNRRLARLFGYDLERMKKQVLVESHLRFLLDLLRVDVVLDVGANEGQYVSALREVVGYKGTIHSFEPLPAAYEVLCNKSVHDPLWHVHNTALGDEEGEVELKVSNKTVFSSLHEANEQGQAKFKSGIAVAETVNVPMQRLDTLLPAIGVAPDQQRTFLKMDTQGHDAWVFAGASGIADHLVGLQSEVSVVGIYEGVPTYLELLAIYQNAGFELTGAYTINRYRDTGHIVELDCVFARK